MYTLLQYTSLDYFFLHTSVLVAFEETKKGKVYFGLKGVDVYREEEGRGMKAELYLDKALFLFFIHHSCIPDSKYAMRFW